MAISEIFGTLKRIFFHVEQYGGEGYKLWKSKHDRNEKLIKYSLNGLKHELQMRTGSSDYSTFSQVFFESQYEYELKAPPKVILDCGANIGLASIYFANKYPGAKIIAIEPEKKNFEILKMNTEKYGNITCLNNGIWSKKSNLEITNPDGESWGFITTEVGYDDENTISAISIKDVMTQFSLERIDILKIDIEGSEKEVFECNNKEWIDYTGLIIIELHDRLREGTANAFFNAVNGYRYSLSLKGENIFCEINHS